MATNNNSFPPLDSSLPGPNRAGSSPTTTHGGGQVNGNGGTNGANFMAPLPVGHQQDLNYLYAQIQELSSILKSNREKVNVVTKAAEEVAVCASDETSEPADEWTDRCTEAGEWCACRGRRRPCQCPSVVTPLMLRCTALTWGSRSAHPRTRA